jgi:CheY-like chemotaxis protein
MMAYPLQFFGEMQANAKENGAKLLVLLADDDEELRFILARVLTKEGYDIEELSDFQSLFLRLDRHNVPTDEAHKKMALVSDVYMHGGDAITAVASLKAKLEGLPIVFITSTRDEEATEQGMRLGAKAVLSKPVDFAELKQLLSHIAETT